jgi:hypothetical protein
MNERKDRKGITDNSNVSLPSHFTFSRQENLRQLAEKFDRKVGYLS